MTEPIRRPATNGAATLLTATIAAGLGGYLVTWIAYRLAGPAEYATFAVFWAALYLVVGALSGVQQEIARATHPLAEGERPGPPTARNFGIAVAFVVMIVVVGTAVFWGPVVFPASTWALVLPLTVGAGSYTLVAVLAGSLYGVQGWRQLAIMIVGDAAVRLAAVAIGGLLGMDAVGLAWLIVVPFPLVLAALWPVVRGRIVGRTRVDVGSGALAANVSRTLVASTSTALMVSGFPLLIATASDGAHTALLGEVIFITTLVRAPLIVGVMSLQSYLVVRFRGEPHALRGMLLVVAAVLAAGAVLTVPAVLLGEPVLGFITGGTPSVEPWFYGVLVISSALVAALTVTGAALLAASRHVAYSFGWAAAAVVTVVAIAFADGVVQAVTFSAVAGPLAGLLVHSVWFVATRRGR